MAAPFCVSCGAAVVEGTRFCVKCGQPIGQAAPSPDPEATRVVPPPPAVPAQFPPQPASGIPSGLQPGVQPGYQPAMPPEPSVKSGGGAGIWIGIFGILLLLGGGGAGLWYYTTHGKAAEPAPVAAAPVSVPAPAPTPTTEVPPPNPDFAKPEVPPPNPDFAKKDEAPAPKPTTPAPSKPTTPAPAGDPAPALTPRLARTTNPTSGTLHASVEVAQNGEVVFENLPGQRLKFTFDRTAWKPTISHQANGTQTLVMRSLKPGIQRTCDVTWEIVP